MSGTIRNLFGGVARCPLCGGSMTRVSKGEGNGRPYLVCAKAKVGAGCRYRGVPYEQLEEAFVSNTNRVIATAPAGGDGDLDERLDKLDGNISGVELAIEDILHGMERGTSSFAERRLLRKLESELEQKERERADLVREQAEVTGPLVLQRLDTLEAALREPAIDRTKVNVLLRQLLTAAVVDYRTGQLVLHWKHGGESDVMFAWPEEETVWGERQQA
jgi:hypothetical protein